MAHCAVLFLLIVLSTFCSSDALWRATQCGRGAASTEGKDDGRKSYEEMSGHWSLLRLQGATKRLGYAASYTRMNQER